MADDLLSGNAASDAYSASSIEVLEGLEPVRKRPGMYIGGTDERALHHLVAEILDNSMDEAVAGHATRIEVELLADGSTVVRDNGRGIPVDPHPKFPAKSALEVILCTLHAGGKFSGDTYQTSGGLHGVGASVVNALSDLMVVQVARNKELFEQRFSRGIPQGPVAKIIAVIIIISTGLALAFGDTSGGFRKLIQIVFGLSIAFAASSFFLSFFSFGVERSSDGRRT